MESLQFGATYWEDKLGDLSNESLNTKLHLILSLVLFLGVSVCHLLVFIFTTQIKPVKDRAAQFLGYTPSHTDPNTKAIMLEESNRVITDISLQICIKDLTISRIRELLDPSKLADKYCTLAPFFFELLHVFVASPNKYRKYNMGHSSEMEGNDTHIPERGAGDVADWSDDPNEDYDEARHPEAEPMSKNGFVLTGTEIGSRRRIQNVRADSRRWSIVGERRCDAKSAVGGAKPTVRGDAITRGELGLHTLQAYNAAQRGWSSREFGPIPEADEYGLGHDGGVTALGRHVQSARFPKPTSTASRTSTPTSQWAGFEGFSRNPIFAIILVISMLAFVRNCATNLLPLLLCLFFKISSTSTRVIRMLSNVGVCISSRTAEQLKECISEDAIRLGVALACSRKMFMTIFNNINIFLRKSQQRLTNQNSMIHATNVTLFALEGIDPAAQDLKPKPDMCGERKKATVEEILPTNDDDTHMEQSFIALIAKMIVVYCPGSRDWKDRKEMLGEIEKMMPKDCPLEPKKTDACPFGVFDINEGTKKGVIDVVDAI
ncbi:hypothetical protein B0H10DRAFT_1938899 [Mycena sp. CBHHK59/15]|nr:hypothetical protein B0H10DRAFT_1938899 [Mycena sp. CBHHK59/15]